MAAKLTKKQQGELTEKLTGIIQKNNALQLRLSADRSVNEMNVNQISGALNRIHGQAIGKDLPTVVTIPVKQLGSGDPSPDNIRPIVGYEIDGIGTVYDGELNIETKVLTVPSVYYYFKQIASVATGAYRRWLYPKLRITSINTEYGIGHYYSNMYQSRRIVYPGNFYVTSSGTVLVTVPYAAQQNIETVVDANAWLTNYPLEVVIPRETPETYTLTDQQMLQLLDQL